MSNMCDAVLTMSKIQLHTCDFKGCYIASCVKTERFPPCDFHFHSRVLWWLFPVCVHYSTCFAFFLGHRPVFKDNAIIPPIIKHRKITHVMKFPESRWSAACWFFIFTAVTNTSFKFSHGKLKSTHTVQSFG